MAIKISMSLEGTEKIESQIDSVAKKGEGLNKSLNDIGKGGLGVDKIANDLKNAGLNFEQTSEKAIKLNGTFNVLRASLKLLGVEGSGALGSLSRLFSGGGAIALGAVATGVAAVKIGQMEESLARLSGELSDTFGSSQKGVQAFSALEKSAAQFGSSVTGLAPVLNSFQTALSNVDRTAKGFVALREEDLPFPDPKNVQAATTAVDSFIKILRAGRLTQDDAEKSAKAFFDAFKEGGPITSAAVRQLPVGTINLLKDALGAAGLKSKEFFAALDAGAVPFDKFAAALEKFGPQAQQAFDSKAIKTMGDEFDKLLATLNKGFAAATGKTFSNAIIVMLDSINTALDKSISKAGDWLKVATDIASRVVVGPQQNFGPEFTEAFGTLPEKTKELGKGFINATQSLQQLGAAGVQELGKVGNAAQQAGDKIKALSAEDFKVGGKFGPQVASPFGQGIASPFGGPGADAEAAKAGKQSGKTFVENFNTTVEQTAPSLPSPVEIPVKPVVSVDEIEATAFAAGERYFTKLKEGIDAQPPPEFPGIITGLEQAGQAATAAAQTLWNSIKAILEQPIRFNFQAPDTGLAGGPFIGGAAGGQMFGPGTTTSDSILARLSNREWIINAKAVDFYGSSLFAALNSMRLPRSLLGAMPKFAEGGAVSTANSNRSLTLVLDQKRFGVTGSKGTVDDLEREASLRGLAMIGKAPSWIR